MVDIPDCKTLRLVLGDQLNRQHPWFESSDPDVLYLVAELPQESTYVRHHVQKIAAFFAAMQAFASDLEERGHRVLHLTLDETAEFDDLPGLLDFITEQAGAEQVEYQRPDEYRLVKQLSTWARQAELTVTCCRSHHFLLPFADIEQAFPDDKSQRMEHFYRRMRRRFDILMEKDGKPAGGQWNFDPENRKRLPDDVEVPDALVFDNPIKPILQRLGDHGIKTLGHSDAESLPWPIDRRQSLQLLDYFVDCLLPRFGDYQDALSGRHWALFHSRLSFSLNTKMLSPEEVIRRATDAWGDDPDSIPLSSVEGFVRQILGWREFMRGIYWSRMPGYAALNQLEHERPLPEFYWTGETRMNCMSQAINQSLDHAYAHHIQRLMVTGNFALLAGVDPDRVDQWYLGIYIDAIEWVEMPNTRGMSQFADGGIIASKPYVSSGNYIKRMGDHCKSCHYKVSARSGDRSCPFNSLYWHFMQRHRDWQESNARVGMIYRNWDRMGSSRQNAILQTADDYLQNIDSL